MPNSIFAVNIKKDKLLGNVFLPFFIYKDNEKYFKKSKLVTFTDIDSQNFSFSDWVVKIIKISHSISYAELNKRFNKNKLFLVKIYFLIAGIYMSLIQQKNCLKYFIEGMKCGQNKKN